MNLNVLEWYAAFIKPFSQNTGNDYVIAMGVFFVSFVVLYLFKIYAITHLRKIAKKTTVEFDDVLIAGIDAIGLPFFALLAIFIGSRFIVMHAFINQIVFRYAFLLFGIYYGVKVLTAMINARAHQVIEKRMHEEKGANTSMVRTLSIMLKVLVWLIAFLVLLSGFGVKITPLLAGLGVGGIAIAFALQNVLADLFASFSIYFDKPFTEGDYIVTGTERGTVKHVGLKSTRIQSLDGEEVILPNKKLTDSEIHNFKRMDRRRILFRLGVEYDTPLPKLKLVNKLLDDIFRKNKMATLDRAHFVQFGDSSLVFEIVYFVESAEMKEYMDVQQQINFAIKEAFEKNKIVMAFPTQTLYLKK